MAQQEKCCRNLQQVNYSHVDNSPTSTSTTTEMVTCCHCHCCCCRQSGYWQWIPATPTYPNYYPNYYQVTC